MKYKVPEFYTIKLIRDIKDRFDTLEISDMLIGIAFNEEDLNVFIPGVYDDCF